MLREYGVEHAHDLLVATIRQLLTEPVLGVTQLGKSRSVTIRRANSSSVSTIALISTHRKQIPSAKASIVVRGNEFIDAGIPTVGIWY
jgi:hypothetical protein